MFDPTRNWPFGLNRTNWPRYLAGCLVTFAALAVLDAPVTRAVAALPDAARAPFHIITRAGNSDWILIPSLLVTIIGFLLVRFALRGYLRRRAGSVTSVALFIFVAVAAPGLVSNLIKRLVGRARPTHFPELGTLHFQPFHDWSFQSFPSGDTTTIFALAAVIMVMRPGTRWWVLAGAALVGLSRIMVGVHFPTDVFGGFVLGSCGAYAVRNFCASRGWLFIRLGDRRIVLNLDWPDASQTKAER